MHLLKSLIVAIFTWTFLRAMSTHVAKQPLYFGETWFSGASVIDWRVISTGLGREGTHPPLAALLASEVASAPVHHGDKMASHSASKYFTGGKFLQLPVVWIRASEAAPCTFDTFCAILRLHCCSPVQLSSSLTSASRSVLCRTPSVTAAGPVANRQHYGQGNFRRLMLIGQPGQYWLI